MLFTKRGTYADHNPKSHKALGITPVAIIDLQLPFEYTITSRSTDVVVVRQLVLRVEKKMYVIEQPLPAAPAANSAANVLENGMQFMMHIMSNDIYEIDMHDLVPNVNSIYNISTKRVKHNLDSTYLWHCRLAHISKKRIEKLQQEGLLKSTDDESFDQCVSCLSGKMTRKLFPHRPKRATNLLGIIHTDVCGPLRHVLRQGDSYFIIFTDDYSRYGYVYLLKHKHEVFETFKVFKNEVENQLEKTIKALRSDQDGKYISQEFKDYLQACGIFQQITPPYTPQHNRVSKRRNRTLLDMVRSMMNLTTLSLSFWDYALESATRILNMGCEALVKRDTPDKLQQRFVKCIFIGYPMEIMGYYFYFPPENKIVVTRYAEFFEKNLITQEVNGRAIDLEEIQDEDTSPSEITSEIPMEVEGFLPPQEEVIPILRAIRILISIVAFYDYEIWKMDVKTAFLNGYLDEDIYMVQPEGFVHPNHPRKVCKLQRSIYGLKQASRSWNKRFDEEIKSLQGVKDYLGKCFAMKDLGEASFILGIKIYRDSHIPMQERLDLNKTQGASTPEEVKRMQNVPYASVVGSTMYVVRCTRPDVAFA
nr:hypothetical protein [Tanacetum cinerariifolium]